ncbi:MAG: RluA family pseudouridine synthase [Pseudomonadota bacterium]
MGPLEVLHRDDDVLVLNKPSGLLSVPGNRPDLLDSLEGRAKALHPTATIVHRLDGDTSGVMVMGLHRAAVRALGRQFETRAVSKTYEAIVWGDMADDEGVVDLPLRCDWPNRPRQMVDRGGGKPAWTAWRREARLPEPARTRVALRPTTGRSHQLRVHMMSLGHPILGDAFYAGDDAFDAAPRLLLHAHRLTFAHPLDGRRMTFTAPVPF